MSVTTNFRKKVSKFVNCEGMTEVFWTQTILLSMHAMKWRSLSESLDTHLLLIRIRRLLKDLMNLYHQYRLRRQMESL